MPDSDDKPTIEGDEYQRDYYEKHKSEILAKRRSRYTEDLEFRMRRQAYARQRRTEERAQEKKKRAGLPTKKRHSGPLPPKVHTIEVNGVDVEATMYSTGQLAKALGKSIKTIRAWEARGILPEAMYRGQRNMRLYTELQVTEIVGAFAASRKADRTLTLYQISRSLFPELTRKIWQEYPLGVDLSET